MTIAGGLAAVVATTADRPLYHADLWGHLAYGRFLWHHGGLPATEPLMPLSTEPFVNFAWGAQVLGYLLYAAAGPEGVRLLGGVLTGLTVVLAGTAAARRGGGAAGGVAGAGLFLAGAWATLFAAAPWVQPWGPQMVRPQSAGVLLFCLIAAAAPAPRRPGWRWWGLPAAFLLWANLHGGWPLGLAWLGRSTGDDAWKRLSRGGVRAVVRSRRVRAGAAVTGLCGLACCGNPRGPGAFADVLTFARHPNLADIVEWQPLTLARPQGRVFLGVAAVLAVLLWRSPRRVRVSEAVMLLGFGAAAWGLAGRWTVWWAVAAAVSGGSRVRGFRSITPRRPRAAVAAGLAAGALLSTPAWRLAGGVTAGRGCLAAGTAVHAARAVRAAGVRGLVLNDHAFGDYLLWAVPSARPVLASHAHLIPPDVWRSAFVTLAAGPGWSRTLDRWGVRVLLLAPSRQPDLIAAADASPEWRRVYEDDLAVLFMRRRAGPRPPAGRPPTGGAAAAPASATPGPAPAWGPAGRSRR